MGDGLHSPTRLRARACSPGHSHAFIEPLPLLKHALPFTGMEFGSDVCFVDEHGDTEDIFQLEINDGLANCAKEQAQAWRDAADEEGRSNAGFSLVTITSIHSSLQP